MSRKVSKTLTDSELLIMNVIWDRGEAVVKDIIDCLPKDTPMAYSTVNTFLRILEKKGYIKHKKSGRAYRFYPVLNRSSVEKSALGHIIKDFFHGSPQKLVMSLVDDEKLTPEEQKLLDKLIDKME